MWTSHHTCWKIYQSVPGVRFYLFWTFYLDGGWLCPEASSVSTLSPLKKNLWGGRKIKSHPYSCPFLIPCPFSPPFSTSLPCHQSSYIISYCFSGRNCASLSWSNNAREDTDKDFQLPQGENSSRLFPKYPIYTNRWMSLCMHACVFVCVIINFFEDFWSSRVTFFRYTLVYWFLQHIQKNIQLQIFFFVNRM